MLGARGMWKVPVGVCGMFYALHTGSSSAFLVDEEDED
jgi:hypothetical protein